MVMGFQCPIGGRSQPLDLTPDSRADFIRRPLAFCLLTLFLIGTVPKRQDLQMDPRSRAFLSMKISKNEDLTEIQVLRFYKILETNLSLPAFDIANCRHFFKTYKKDV